MAIHRASSTGSSSSTAGVNRSPPKPPPSSKGTASSSTAQPPSSSAQASASLALLLREDRLLTQHELHVPGKSEEASFSYAAALLEEEQNDGSGTSETQQRAIDALGEVDRKLALVESLAERVSRTSPEAVAGPLLRLHGYTLLDAEDGEGTTTTTPTTTTTLAATRERCDRLKRQGEVLEGVATRVETSLQRGLKRMETSTSRLSRVLQLSATLKMILRLQFESSKLEGYVLDDLRDLTRAAASVAAIEDLLARPELKNGPPIHVVEAMRPDTERIAQAVRRAAANLLAQHHENTSASSSAAVVQLGATLQVYYHLGELPQAAWGAVEHGLATAEKATADFFSPTALSRLVETATAEAKLAVGAGKKTGTGDTALARSLKNKLRELRAEAATKWAAGITNAALQVWNLHRVLCRKSDPVSRQVFVDVVSASPIPDQFRPFYRKDSEFSIFALFWGKMCQSLSERLEYILDYDNGKIGHDVAALYPAVRKAALDMLGSLHDTMQASSAVTSLDDSAATATTSTGILGGSAALDDAFLAWNSASAEPVASTTLLGGAASADSWTRAENTTANGGGTDESGDRHSTSTTTSLLSAVFQSSEWKALQGNVHNRGGLYPLQGAFVQASTDRLCAPLSYMFPENVAVDEDGVALAALPLLPSRYDVQKFDVSIRQELSLADPREGGGDLSMTTMIAETVVEMVERFCDRARNAGSNVGEDGCLNSDGTASDALLHDFKMASIMSGLATSLRNAPESTFVAPYRPAISSQHEEAATMCEIALRPALQQIETMVTKLILNPLCRALNRRVASAIAVMHHGTYLEEALGGLDGAGTSFVDKHLSQLYESIATHHLSQLPPEYAAIVASTVASFSIFTFVSNVSLVRPLGETGRLHITQDLADFELALEQFVFKSGGSISLGQIEHGKPYAELRAVRQMLFWVGLEDSSQPAAIVAKSILREVWVKDVRPSTVFHFLFSFAPSLLSSPHHAKRMRPEKYVGTIVHLDGSVDEGEASAWMTTMACCDSYQQRESVDQSSTDGDRRIAAILMMLGPELLRRRRH